MKVGEGVNVNMSGPKKKERRPHVDCGPGLQKKTHVDPDELQKKSSRKQSLSHGTKTG